MDSHRVESGRVQEAGNISGSGRVTIFVGRVGSWNLDPRATLLYSLYSPPVQAWCALRVLRSHGSQRNRWRRVSSNGGKLLYCAPAWSTWLLFSCYDSDLGLTRFYVVAINYRLYGKHYVDVSTMSQEVSHHIEQQITCHLHVHICLSGQNIILTIRTRNHNKFLIPKTSDLGDRHFRTECTIKPNADAILYKPNLGL